MINFQDPIYLITVLFFVIGLERMGKPSTAASGILWAGVAMALSVAVTFFIPGISNIPLILIGVALGSSAGWYAAQKVQMVSMPQMVAIYNGMGAGAAAFIAAIDLLKFSGTTLSLTLALSGGIIGSVSIAGSMVAFLKLQGWIGQKPFVFRMQQPVNIAILAVSVIFGVIYILYGTGSVSMLVVLSILFVFSAAYGVLMALPIGGADMPVVIALLNALTGIAVALEGYSLSNYAMVVAGILVGASGSILTLAMAKAMNRSLSAVLFGAFGQDQGDNGDIKGTLKPVEPEDAAILLAYANKVTVVPGFGMASAQAQFLVKDLLDILSSRGVNVTFSIHPVAGRMPGHMNVLLAEAGIPYELLLDVDIANIEMDSTDVALVIGANDVVNPVARTPGSALYGMPIIDADKAKKVIVLKRGKGKGFAGIENGLFYLPNTDMLYGDAKESLSKLIEVIKRM